jgi:hypothetical protein
MVGVSSLPDAERAASDVVQALAGLAALLARPTLGGPHAADRGPAFDNEALDEARRGLLHLAEDGGVAAQRVLAYLRSLRGAGDGEAVAVPPRLGEWRDWVPPRGMILGSIGIARRVGELPQPRRFDPGE